MLCRKSSLLSYTFHSTFTVCYLKKCRCKRQNTAFFVFWWKTQFGQFLLLLVMETKAAHISRQPSLPPKLSLRLSPWKSVLYSSSRLTRQLCIQNLSLSSLLLKNPIRKFAPINHGILRKCKVAMNGAHWPFILLWRKQKFSHSEIDSAFQARFTFPFPVFERAHNCVLYRKKKVSKALM